MTRLPDFRLETYFSRWEFAARHHLTASDAQTMPMAELLALADDEDRSAWETLSLGYTETFGDPALRAAIAATYEQADPDDVICFAGAEEALYLAMQVLLGPDDHAVVLTPNYQAAETVPLALCAVTGVALDASRDWALDLDAVAAAIRPNTKVVSVNFPNNPTGTVLSDAGLHCAGRVVRRARHPPVQRRGLSRPRTRSAAHTAAGGRPLGAGVVVERHVEIAADCPVCGSAGSRAGTVAVRAALEKAKHYTTICNAAPSEILARIAIKAAGVDPRAQPRDHRHQPATVRRILRAASPSCSTGSTRTVAASPIRAIAALATSRRSATTWSRRPVCCCCPRASTDPS